MESPFARLLPLKHFLNVKNMFPEDVIDLAEHREQFMGISLGQRLRTQLGKAVLRRSFHVSRPVR